MYLVMDPSQFANMAATLIVDSFAPVTVFFLKKIVQLTAAV